MLNLFQHLSKRSRNKFGMTLELGMNMNILKMENITMQFGGVVAVDNLSLEVNEGEIVSIMSRQENASRVFFASESDILDGKPTAIQPTAATDNILDFETLSDKDLANEKVMLSLRTASGLELDSLEPEHLAAIRPTLNRMLEDGRLVPTKKGLRIPADRLFVSDAIISDLFL